MKKYALNLATCFMLLCFVSNLSATDIYLSAKGNDSKSGLTSKDAVATLSKAVKLVTGNGYVIKVSGFIDISKEVSGANGVLSNRVISLEGENKETSGFDGGGITRIINFEGAFDKTNTATLKNLTFRNGLSREGGAVRVVNSEKFRFENCLFTGNSTTGTGTLHLHNVGKVDVINCEFRNNNAKSGGAIYENNGAKVNVESCLIENNDNSAVAGSSGGAIYITNPNGFTINKCIIKNNKVAGNGGAIAIANSSYPDKTVSITNTLIAYNKSENSSGGGIYIIDAASERNIEFSLINSTIYANTAKVYGGAIFTDNAQNGSFVKLINNTIVENKSESGPGFAPGLSFRSSGDRFIKKYIYNCIIENNICTDGRTGALADIASDKFNTRDEEDFILRNSYFGSLNGNTFGNKPEYNNTLNYGVTKAADLAPSSENYINSQNSIPLNSNSEGLKKGNAQYLKELNITTDQLGNPRTFVGNTCAVGAVEIP
ncbi:hypothetical protein EZS27_000916 [termite gut metagenome]|uniref:Right handed beta helix domain-containing protein n=1 Tax=termite gut metagenome TaxID=433724 RepID=A0A5J4T2B9_9ZZZZ